MAAAEREVVSRVRVVGRSEGLDKVKTDLRDVAKAGDEVTVSTTRQERAQISAARALGTWERQLDKAARDQQNMARIERDLARAREQGLVSYQRSAQLMDLLAQRSRLMAAANDNAAASSSRLARATSEIASSLSPLSGVAGVVARSLGTVGIGLGVVAAMASPIAAAGSAWTGYENQLKAAGTEQTQLNARMRELTAMAIGSRSSLSATVDLYAGLTKSTESLGKSQSQVAQVTSTVTKAFSLGGQSAASASGAILQLNQAFAAGALRGDELNSVLEGAPSLARLIAREFGVAVGELKSLGEEGKLTADRVFNALLKGSQEIDATFAKTNPTIGQGFEVLKTGLVALGAEVDKSTGLSSLMAAGLELIGKAAADTAEKVDQVRLAGQNVRITSLQEKLDQLRGTEMQFALSLNIPGRNNPELDRVKQEIASTERLLTEALGNIDARIQAMVGLPGQVLRPMSDELSAMASAADNASRAMSATGSAADSAGASLANAAVKARSFSDALNSIRAANPDLSSAISLVKQIGDVQKSVAEGTKGIMKEFQDGAIGDQQAQARIKELGDTAAASIKALKDAAAKPGDTFIRQSEISAMDELPGKIAKAADAYDALRKSENIRYDELARAAATPEARGLVEAERVARMQALERAQNQVLATERKAYAERQARKGGGGSSEGSDAFDNALQRSRDQIEELKLQAEQASKTTLEVYKLAEAHRLRRAAIQAGRGDEAGITAQIDAQADAYARQRIATDQAIEAQRRMQEAVRDLGSTITTFAEDVLTGGLQSALKSLGRDTLRNSLNALISGSGPLAVSAGLAPTEKGGVGGIFGSDFFNRMTKAVSAGTEGGWTSLFGSSPQQGPLANGKTLDTLTGSTGNLAGVMQGIGGIVGSYGIGVGAGSMGQSLAGGAISGEIGGLDLAANLGDGE